MFFYWLLFLIPVYFLFAKSNGGKYTSLSEWRLLGFFLIIFIGLRHRVGGDWFTYIEGLESHGVENNIQWINFFSIRDPVFTLISWISIYLGMNIYGVNLICAMIFTGGLINLSRAQPYPWLAILVAIPYLLIVVAMGYTRQAAAIGLLMYAYGYLTSNRLPKFLALVLLAGLIHKTAFIFAAFVFFVPGGSKLKGILGVSLLFVLMGGAYLVEQAETLILHYVVENMESGGGLIRVLMNLIPALILFFYRKKWSQIFEDRWLWGVFALLSFACVPIVSLASTAVDRMALYLIPLQLVVWARFPLLVQGRISRNFAFIIIATYYAVVQFTYLVYGTFVAAWLPYDNLLFSPF